ncbi:hypothetical protein QE152_g41612, partial [Popillia japonica]
LAGWVSPQFAHVGGSFFGLGHSPDGCSPPQDTHLRGAVHLAHVGGSFFGLGHSPDGCSPPQDAHVGGSFFGLGHSPDGCSPPQDTHLRGAVHLDWAWPYR